MSQVIDSTTDYRFSISLSLCFREQTLMAIVFCAYPGFFCSEEFCRLDCSLFRIISSSPSFSATVVSGLPSNLSAYSVFVS